MQERICALSENSWPNVHSQQLLEHELARIGKLHAIEVRTVIAGTTMMDVLLVIVGSNHTTAFAHMNLESVRSIVDATLVKSGCTVGTHAITFHLSIPKSPIT